MPTGGLGSDTFDLPLMLLGWSIGGTDFTPVLTEILDILNGCQMLVGGDVD